MTLADVEAGFTDLAPGEDERFFAMLDVVLAHQRRHNPVYSRYCKAMGKVEGSLPLFLPVQAFKEAAVTTFPAEEAKRVFVSSGTGSGRPARHLVRDITVYERSAGVHFEQTFGDGPFRFAAHLPGYVERGQTSSLLYMVEMLMRRFGVPGSGSILAAPERLDLLGEESRRDEVPLVLFGAAFGLLDIVENRSWSLPDNAFVIETGGMKTRRREVTRDELHGRIAGGLGLRRSAIWSEYGMCELLSQSYARGGGVFHPPAWMRCWVVDPAAPFEERPEGTPGALAIADLANLHSASAVLTEDRAVRRDNGFDVLGRRTGAELRGCNFLLDHV